MGKINTTAIGDKFEDKAFRIFKSLLEDDNLEFDKNKSEIFQKKKYYSDKRGNYITFDISIEVSRPESEKYSFLGLIECKGYGEKNSVDVNEVEVFSSHLTQAALHNSKGIIVTSSQFTKDAINYARSTGITLIRISDNKLIYDVERTTRFANNNLQNEVIDSLLGEMYHHSNVAILDKYPYDDFYLFFQAMGILDTKPKNKISSLKLPYLSVDDIENICQNITKDEVMTQEVNLQSILSKLKINDSIATNFETDLGYSNGKEILGKLSLIEKCIYISNKIEKDSPRWRFTLAHEIGHYVLHYNLLNSLYCEIQDTESVFQDKISIEDKTVRRLEYQANIFASSLLMPKAIFLAFTSSVFLQNRVNKGRLFYDNQPTNQNLYHTVVGTISNKFRASKQAVKYRLKSMGLLEEETTNYLNKRNRCY